MTCNFLSRKTAGRSYIYHTNLVPYKTRGFVDSNAVDYFSFGVKLRLYGAVKVTHVMPKVAISLV